MHCFGIVLHNDERLECFVINRITLNTLYALMCLKAMIHSCILQCLKTSSTVQTFNSCISRPNVCQCPVAHTPMATMSK